MKIKEWFLKREIARTPRYSTFRNWNEIKSVLVLFDSDLSEDNNEVKNFIRTIEAEGKKVTSCYYVNKKRSESKQSDGCIFVIDRSLLNIFEKPKNKQTFARTEFDVVIDLTLEHTFPLEYILLWVKTQLRCGKKKDGITLYDFMIELPYDENGKSGSRHSYEVCLGEQIIRYLKQFKST